MTEIQDPKDKDYKETPYILLTYDSKKDLAKMANLLMEAFDYVPVGGVTAEKKY